ncbi:MAG: hypothetical protein AAGD96_30920, partial [Chloroflexota bacterium]
MFSTSKVKKFLLVFLSMLTLSCLSAGSMWKRFGYALTGIDDANIFFVYAQNISRGFGFVFNAGGERVEGFSSILWTLICSFAFYISSQPELLLLIFNVLTLALCASLAVYWLGDEILQGYKSPVKLMWLLIFIGIIFSTPAYIIWNTISLMENALWS